MARAFTHKTEQNTTSPDVDALEADRLLDAANGSEDFSKVQHYAD
jgi:hypothetical protein